MDPHAYRHRHLLGIEGLTPEIDAGRFPAKRSLGDRVTVEVSPYDLEKGRLVFRHKEERAAAISRPPQRNQFRRR